MKKNIVILNTFIVLVACLMTFGCFKRAVETRNSLPDIVWPKAPNIPRIRFVNSVSKPAHFQIATGVFKRFLRYLGGRPERSIVAPYGLEVDSSGRLYVVDTFLKTVHLFDLPGNTYYTFSTEETSFISPIDLAIDDETGYVYVTDSKEGAIKIFKDMGRAFVGELRTDKLERPTGIAINKKTSELLVLDTLRARVLRYGLKDLKLVGFFGDDGEEEGRFHFPTNIDVAEDGTIIVSDSLNFRIQMFSSEGVFLRRFGSLGDNPGHFSRPKGVATDSDGNIYVVDGLFDNVQVFDKEGRLLMEFGGHGNGYGEFWLPTGIYIDKNNMIYVSDSYNKRVQIFQYMGKDEFSE